MFPQVFWSSAILDSRLVRLVLRWYSDIKPALSYPDPLQNQSNQSALLIFKGFACALELLSFLCYLESRVQFFKRDRSGHETHESGGDAPRLGTHGGNVPPLRTLILRNPGPYLIVVHRKTSLSSRLSWIVDDQKLAESRE